MFCCVFPCGGFVLEGRILMLKGSPKQNFQGETLECWSSHFDDITGGKNVLMCFRYKKYASKRLCMVIYGVNCVEFYKGIIIEMSNTVSRTPVNTVNT